MTGQAPPPDARVIWERRVIPLEHGENVLGRDEHVAVRIDASGISRRHACIRVGEGRAILADLDSKNGTYLADDDTPITEPVELEDGARFRLGSVLLVFRSRQDASATRNETRPARKLRAGRS